MPDNHDNHQEALKIEEGSQVILIDPNQYHGVYRKVVFAVRKIDGEQANLHYRSFGVKQSVAIPLCLLRKAG